MTHLHKLPKPSYLKRVSLDFTRSNVKSPKMTPFPSESYSHHIVQNMRVYGTKNCNQFEGFSNKDDKVTSRLVWKEARAALLEYLHNTRRIQWLDAEHMTNSSPIFLRNLLKKVNAETEIGSSVARFLLYHPINEFEPFFESIGLKPTEYSPMLPRRLMFLEDDVLLLENFHVLCNYGMPRKHIGKIYKAAAEVFRYDHGVMEGKLHALKDAGLGQSSIIRIVSSSPGLLIGDRSMFLCKVIEKLKSIGIGSEWIEGHVWEVDYNWNHMLALLDLMNTMVSNEEKLQKIIRHCPAFLFDASGNQAFSFLGLLLKFGTEKCDMGYIFLKLPHVQASKFLTNFRRCYKFMVDIHMEVEEIGKIVRSHPVLLGSCSLKKLSTLRNRLAGKKRLRDAFKENPEILKEWVYGSRLSRLPKIEGLTSKSMIMKTKFLLDLGFSMNSNEMQKTVERLHGSAWELQERFDAFMKAGLSREDVVKTIERAPQILGYTMQRIKHRVSMYVWLRDRGCVRRPNSLYSIVARSEDPFMRHLVNKHPMGPQVWHELKKQIYTDSSTLTS